MICPWKALFAFFQLTSLFIEMWVLSTFEWLWMSWAAAGINASSPHQTTKHPCFHCFAYLHREGISPLQGQFMFISFKSHPVATQSISLHISTEVQKVFHILSLLTIFSLLQRINLKRHDGHLAVVLIGMSRNSAHGKHPNFLENVFTVLYDIYIYIHIYICVCVCGGMKTYKKLS